jgi:hypothetical protein
MWQNVSVEMDRNILRRKGIENIRLLIADLVTKLLFGGQNSLLYYACLRDKVQMNKS